MNSRAQPTEKHPSGAVRSEDEKQDRRERVLSHGMPSMVRSIADAVVIKNDQLFFLAQPDGNIPLEGTHGLGLYYRDCRYLCGYEIHLADFQLTPLVATGAQGFAAVFELTNEETILPGGAKLRKNSLGIKWERLLDQDRLTLQELIEIKNFGEETAEFPLVLRFGAGFEDIYTVRQLLDERLGKLRPPEWRDGALRFAYEGADGYQRALAICFSPAPDIQQIDGARFQLKIAPRTTEALSVSIALAETNRSREIDRGACHAPDIKTIHVAIRKSAEAWLRGPTEITSDSLLLNRVIKRSFRDVHTLRSTIREQSFIAGGVPWFVTLFGRDSLISSLCMLAYEPKIAEQTLRLLASYQGTRTDPWRDEEPGKILHELRQGELAHLNEIPHTPYYGSVDATLLFLILIARHAAWTGDLALFDELSDHIEQALAWMARFRNGYVEYSCQSEKGLANQGWKDSGDAIVNQDGTLAKPPIALVEVQGYAYLAKRVVAELYDRRGNPKRGDELRREAQQLRDRFNRDFWLPSKNVYALALQQGKTPAAVVSSNTAHVLWSGIADENKARSIAQRIMEDDMFSGWGVRTLSENERRYNPIGYHLGTVWPHDNAIIAAGLRHYGHDREALRIFGGIVEAAAFFDYGLPELFAGFRREDYGSPVHYPIACHPQAWSAVTVPYLLKTVLGLRPDAFAGKLRLVRPVLPDLVNWIELRRLRVGSGRADLRFERHAGGKIVAHVLQLEGELEVLMVDEAGNELRLSREKEQSQR